ncbi:MAG: cyclase family protein [Bacteroidota bacterium]
MKNGFGKKIWDLTEGYDSIIAGFSSQVSKRLEVDGWNASTYTIYSHAGTHMDAPFHFGVSSTTINQIPIQRFWGEAWVARIPHAKPRQVLTPEDLGSIADLFQRGDSLLIQTDWNQRLGTASFRDELPRIGERLAKFLVQKGINMLGVEPPSVADVNNLEEVTQIHEILLEAEVLIIEGLCNLDKLIGEKVGLIALPLKVNNGDGAPARVIAYEL